MKKIKLYHMGVRMKDIYPHATKWQVFKYKAGRFFFKTMVLASIAGAIYGAFTVGTHFSTDVVYQQAEAKEIIKEVEIKSSVMERIAKCESPTGHYKNGQVVFNANTNKSVDIGKYQINSVWSKTATEMGLDLTNEQDNETFAMWIYKNKGTEPWYSSKSCWNK